MTEHPAAEHPSPVTPQTEAGRTMVGWWERFDNPESSRIRQQVLAIEREAADAARKEVLDEIRVAFESEFDDQWPEWMNEAWHRALDSLARPVEEERK